MEIINVPPTAMQQLLQTAVDYGLAMAETATPEQIERMIRRNLLFERGLQIWHPKIRQPAKERLTTKKPTTSARKLPV